jgi:hypothetical protein
MAITETTLASVPVTIMPAWTAIGDAVDVTGASWGILWVEMTKNDCKGIEMRFCSYRATGGAYEYIPMSDDVDADQAGVEFKRLSVDNPNLAFELPRLGPISKIQMQMRCLAVPEGGTHPTVDAAYLTYE